MAILSTYLACPGARRGRGNPLQVPNILRADAPGGTAVAFSADTVATTTTSGGAQTTWGVSGGVPARLWGGTPDQVGLDLANRAYALFVVPGQDQLWATPQENWQAVSGGTDVGKVAWVDAHHDLVMLKGRRVLRCTNANPIPTVLNDGTAAIADPYGGPPADGTPLATADLSHLIGMAYDATTGTLVLSIAEGGGQPAYAGGIQPGGSALYKVGGDGIMRKLAGMCGNQAGYLAHLNTLFSTYLAPHGLHATTLPIDSTAFPAPEAHQLLCRGGKLYTLQLVTGNNYNYMFSGHTTLLDYTMAAGFIRSYDLTTGAITVIAAIAYTFENLAGLAAIPPLALSADGATFYTTYAPTNAGFPIRYYDGIFAVPNSPVAYVACLVKDYNNQPDWNFETIPAPWAGNLAADPTADAPYADGLGRAVGSSGRAFALAVDGHGNLLVEGIQEATAATTDWIRAVDAAAATWRGVIGNTHGTTWTTRWARDLAAIPAYPGDPAIGNDGNSANSTAATWGGIDPPAVAQAGAPTPTTDAIGINRGTRRHMLCIDRAANILYYRDGLEAIRSIKLDDANRLCTLTGGPSILTAAHGTDGAAVGPAQGMRRYYTPILAVDESTGSLYFTSARDSNDSDHYCHIALYRAKFY